MPNSKLGNSRPLQSEIQNSIFAALLLLVLSVLLAQNAFPESGIEPQKQSPIKVRIGCKEFTESYIMAEYLAQQLEHQFGERVQIIRSYGLGSTSIAFQALTSGSIDIYPEYTGTLLQLTSERSLELALRKSKLVATQSLGFANSYGLALTKIARSERLGSISDRSSISIADLERDGTQLESLRIGLSYEFFGRSDGWTSILSKHPRLSLAPKPILMDHSLLYTAAVNQKVDLIEVYTTDPQIDDLGLTVLNDSLRALPDYDAIYIAQSKWATDTAEIWKFTENLNDSLELQTIRDLNKKVEVDGLTPEQAVRDYLKSRFGNSTLSAAEPPQLFERIKRGFSESIFWRSFREHFSLVVVASLISFLIGIPIGILVSDRPRLGQPLLTVSGVLQTIPAIALLVVLVPLFGLGYWTAVTALVTYATFPVASSTSAGLNSLSPETKDLIRLLHLSRWQSLRWVRFPVARLAILSGLRIALVATIGNATLAALIGAGGFGALILSGLSTHRMELVLLGAIPAALAALLVQTGFSWIERTLK